VPASPADAEVPIAYMKYFIFNRQMQMTQHGHEPLDKTTLKNWKYLSKKMPFPKPFINRSRLQTKRSVST